MRLTHSRQESTADFFRRRKNQADVKFLPAAMSPMSGGASLLRPNRLKIGNISG
jgi:hypothetical protein